MENAQELENEIKYFELLNGGLMALKFLQNGEEFDVKSVLMQTKYLRNLKLDFSIASFFEPYLSAFSSRQFITTFRDKTENINFSKIENDKRYVELKHNLFDDYPDMPDNECDRILKSIANELAHGNVVKFFDFNKFAEYYNRIKHEKTPNYVALQVFRKNMLKLFIDILSPEFNFVSHYEKLPDGKTKKRENPKVFKLNLNLRQMNSLVFVADHATNEKKYTFNYNFDRDYNLFISDEKLKKFIDEIEILHGDKKIELDEIQKEDLFNIFQHYFISANENRFNLNNIFDVCIERVLVDAKLRKIDLIGIDYFLIDIFDAKTPTELQKAVLADCYKEDLSDLETNRILYSFEIDNLYSELLITVVVNLLKQLENKKLYNELANTSFIAELTADLEEKDKANITKRDKLKVIHTIRNALMHNRYINNANATIDLYDEKHIDEEHLKARAKQTNKTLISKAIKTKPEKKIEFKFGLEVEDLEDIKDLCLQILIENYRQVLSQTKKQ